MDYNDLTGNLVGLNTKNLSVSETVISFIDAALPFQTSIVDDIDNPT